MAKYEKMVEFQKERSKKRVEEIKNEVLNMKKRNERISPYTVWVKTGCSKSFIYTRKELLDFINSYRTPKVRKTV